MENIFENYDEMMRENARRNEVLQIEPYDPLIGNPADDSRVARFVGCVNTVCHLPREMVESREFTAACSLSAYTSLRLRYDFEYWAARCVKIRHKLTGQQVPFVLNVPQRRVLSILEADRRAGRPLRLIMLKARQWGGSTLIQMYFAWIQIVHRRNWNSLICAHVKDTAAAIRGMYDSMLADYPEELWEEDEPPRFVSWQKSQNTREIAGRQAKVTVSSSYGQDAARGLDFSMAHLSEVAFWRSTDRNTPEDFVRNVCGGIPMVPYSVIVLESTANGVGNYFHRQWLAAEEERSAFRAVFVPWYEIDMYRMEIDDARALIAGFTPYEKWLWKQGLTLEMIQWYHSKRGEFPSDEAMHAEYPATPTEAFTNTGRNVFDNGDIERLRHSCREPESLRRSALPSAQCRLLDTPSVDGELKVWALPPADPVRRRYVVVVDVGGRWVHADYSVVTVFDRSPGGIRDALPEVVAQWRGHCDHDLLAAYAERIARIYGNALLVVESNSLESGREGESQYILEELNQRYRNMYVRVTRDSATGLVVQSRVGFHTNRATKAAAVTALIAAVRDGGYTERDHMACDEMATYELQENGGYAARHGCNDDVLMTRAIGLYVIGSLPPLRGDTNTISILKSR